ncbi:hypothetical protein FHR32_002790 [Streptosporangium album]|uniref:Uncharacterized protein n=1 Tax=Streptosporangium album TaxID=47479 RepID=A0A7W7RUK3_9ACTN|nr:hypothetical protein [Streptosporangium album]MBB4938485.1 hypothetical protein [Streptosporangium album]
MNSARDLDRMRTAILALRRAYDVTPKRFTDLEIPADGAMVAMLAIQASPDWPQVSQALKELRDATAPPRRPPSRR